MGVRGSAKMRLGARWVGPTDAKGEEGDERYWVGAEAPIQCSWCWVLHVVTQTMWLCRVSLGLRFLLLSAYRRFDGVLANLACDDARDRSLHLLRALMWLF